MSLIGNLSQFVIAYTYYASFYIDCIFLNYNFYLVNRTDFCYDQDIINVNLML